MKIAIIGAGLSGCNIYNELKNIDNIELTIFDKARGTGGRLSTKYIDDKFIDHGTPFIELTHTSLEIFLEKKVEENILRKNELAYLPLNGMNKLCSSLINKKDFIKNTKINTIKFIDNKWHIEDTNKNIYRDFDFVVSTIPTKQILELDMPLNQNIKNELEKVTYTSIASLICYSYNNTKLDLTRFQNSEIFHKIIDNSDKYNYKDFSSYVIHFNNSFIQKYKDFSKDEMFAQIYKKLEDDFNADIKKEFETIEHYWKYAFVHQYLDKEFLFDKQMKIGFCGDYFINPNVQSSYDSSLKLSKKIKGLAC